MIEKYEFRLPEEISSKVLPPEEGKFIGYGVRKVEIGPRKPNFALIGETDKCLQKQGGGNFILSWSVIRKYSKKEMDAAKLFLFIPLVYFEPAAEEVGTIYDDGPACKVCHAAAKQVTPLFLPVDRIPRAKDVAKTIAGEIVVSQRFVDLCRTNGITGADFHPVRQKGAKDLRPLGWYQFRVQPPYADIIAPTRTGNTPFDEDDVNEYRCKNGDTIGLNLLSEITISSSSRGNADVIATSQFIGRRAGLLRPERQILISQRVRHVFEEAGIKGYKLEVVYFA